MKPEVFAKRLTLNYTIKSHSSAVTSLAISKDDRIIVSASWDEDEQVKIWNALDGTLLRTITMPKGNMLAGLLVTSVSLSQDGRTVVSGQFDGSLRIWNTSDGTLLRTLKDSYRGVNSVAISQDGRIIVAGSGSKEINVWNVSDGTPLYTLIGHVSNVSSVTISSDGQLIISAGYDHTIRVWNALDGTLLRILRGHLGPVNSVALSSDGRTIVSGGGMIGNVRLGPVESVALSSNSTDIASGDGMILVWNTQNGTLLHKLQDNCGYISVAISPDGSTIVSGNSEPDKENKTIKVWDAKKGKLLRTIQGLEGSVKCITFSSDGHTIASGSRDGTIRVWGLR